MELMNKISEITGLEQHQIYGLISASIIFVIGMYGVVSFTSWETITQP